MKKIILVLMVMSISFYAASQDEQVANGGHTDKGKFVIDANTTLGSIGGIIGGSGTSFLLSSVDGTTIWNIGAEVGYFVIDDLAIKVGFGYGDLDGSSIVSYKFGAKYYAIGSIPIQIDFSGQGGEDIFGTETPSYLGLQAGYAIFIGDMISIEPALRYNLSLNSDFYENIFQIQMGFSIFL
jgi:hypothetical protein